VIVSLVSNGGRLLALDGTNGNVYSSTDGATSWSGAAALPSTGWTSLAWDHVSGTAYAFGTSKAALSGAGTSPWTSVTLPGSWNLGVQRVVAAGYGSTAQGIIACGTNARCLIWNGSTWSDTMPTGSTTGSFVAGCWSESHGRWYLVRNGASPDVWSSADLVTWAKVFTLAGAAVYDVVALGRSLVFSGTQIGFSGGTKTGALLVTVGGATGHVLSPYQPKNAGVDVGSVDLLNTFRRFAAHDGRLIAGRIRATADINTRPLEFVFGPRAGIAQGTVCQ
jgi:hypothetical protein